MGLPSSSPVRLPLHSIGTKHVKPAEVKYAIASLSRNENKRTAYHAYRLPLIVAEKTVRPCLTIRYSLFYFGDAVHISAFKLQYKEKPAYYAPFHEKKHFSSRDNRNSQHFLHQNAMPIGKVELANWTTC